MNLQKQKATHDRRNIGDIKNQASIQKMYGKKKYANFITSGE